ncbi:SET domain-containing protein 5 [Pseudocercospora fuligena]|uniref:SET domain-containing protein 5 n=1 Tax=Pseudocercospora fuligena TaxID=685502 RepID=A0A8H6VF51_9PEZI|nr:SET domain-containing protein 5 [Pseudocercospora fuligena]
MAPPLFRIKATEAKGYGVFATTPISQGTIILRDRKVLTINKPTKDVTRRDTELAFAKLNSEDQDAVMQLAEYHKPGIDETKLQRILRTNSFGDENSGFLYLTISRINHACIPNASHQDGAIVAETDITAGNEICISYDSDKYEGLTAEQRGIVIENTYGFKCDCIACRPSSNRMVSDARRQLILHLKSALDGFQPPDLSFLKTASQEELWHMDWPPVRSRLRRPLGKTQRIEYTFLLAKLREAEGLAGVTVGKAYSEAAWLLFQHLEDYVLECPFLEDIVFLEPARCVQAWMMRALELYKKSCSSGHQNLRIMQENWDEMRQQELLRFVDGSSLARRFPADAFAVQLANPISALRPKRGLSMAECEQLVRERERMK